MITVDPEYVPGSAGEHEAFSLMNDALEAGDCEVLDYPRIVENVQNIPRSITFMVGGVSPTLPKQEVKLRGYVLPDGTLQQVALAHDEKVGVLRRREGETGTGFMDRDLWKTTVVLLFGPKPKGKL